MRLLDLFCGAGGCAMGYHRAGFTEIVGVDECPFKDKRYPFRFIHDDAVDVLRSLLAGMTIGSATGEPCTLKDFDAIHASPPCQGYSRTKTIHAGKPYEKKHPQLIETIRELLKQTGKPWVIENVPGSPLLDPLMLCGSYFGLRVKRHRLFESSVYLMAPGRRCFHPPRGSFIQTGRPIKEGDWVIVAGHISGLKLAGKAMGIDWMSRDELVQAIPPAYTEFIGKQLIDAIRSNEIPLDASPAPPTE